MIISLLSLLSPFPFLSNLPDTPTLNKSLHCRNLRKISQSNQLSDLVLPKINMRKGHCFNLLYFGVYKLLKSWLILVPIDGSVCLSVSRSTQVANVRETEIYLPQRGRGQGIRDRE